MVEPTSDEFSEWVALADAPAEARRSQMRERYEELARLAEDERRAVLAKMAQTEYQLPDDKLRAFTESRLLVWLEMEREQANAMASSYDHVMQGMSGAIAMRRVAIVQTVCRGFSLVQMARLREMIPSVFQEVPRPPPSAVEDRPSEASGEQQARPASPTRSWKFWQRRK